ncbi:substrate-binding domain-containing protein [Spongiactinospora sp. TRM90649]|uniref:substrate-binding domain-containing protein n=1 Tax=Spongiactinospora sp. TRM90649 TaxID=3031114 RepID=UPI0023F85132|nr:substrate-binding domain-containing protein [Spongiactinospora sp. TRM90649]MDF5757263.1 substrate-binding domain-containing protein [Spongiactinospora sp. TRM90649]
MLVPLAGAVALAVLLGVAAFVIVNRDRQCAGGELAVRVVAAPDIQPAVTAIAEEYNAARHKSGDRCVRVGVQAQDSPGVANALAGSGATAGRTEVDLWIPDSEMWLGRVRPGGKPPAVAATVARSPIVLAATRSAASGLRESLGEPSWAKLAEAANAADPDGGAGRVRVLTLDPRRSAVGLGAALAAAGVLRAGGQEDQLIGALKQLSRSLAGSPEALLSSLDVKSRKVPVGVASEQGIWRHNAAKGSADPVAPLYPREGTISLDYPAVVTTADDAVATAARGFAAELGRERARTVLREHGFRTPDGAGGEALSSGAGFAAKPPRALATPDAKAVAALAQSWSRLNLGTRMLALYDVSGTMALPVPRAGMDRMRVISRIGVEGLRLFPPDSEIGFWEFSTHMNGRGTDYRETVPVGPLTEKIGGVLRKNVLARHLAGVRAKPTGDTGLNDTIDAAYERMTEDYQADKINTILVLTDGAGNDDPDGGLSDAEVVKRLKDRYDPAKPVNILIIAFGPDAPKGRRSMQALASATGGELFIAKDVMQVREIFLEGMKRRLCAPNCDG